MRGRNSIDSFTVFVYGAVTVVFLLVIGIVIFYVEQSDNKVDRQIQTCLAEGGTPIVVGHQYTSDFKGCALP